MGYNNIKHPDRLNNKFLEDKTSSPTSLSSDDYNDPQDDVVAYDFSGASPTTDFCGVSNYTLNDDPNNSTYEDEDTNMATKKENPNRYANKTYDDIQAYYKTINPIARYRYEVDANLKNIACYEAWGNRGKVKEDEPNYYTDNEILEYFQKENNIEYLKKIGWQSGDAWFNEIFNLNNKTS